jgi:hypothetical protein
VLHRYRRSGGKLLIYHGTGDAGIPVLATIADYKRLASRMGGLRATQRFARLFVIPGMAHCSLTGLGVNRLDPITAITDWVQSGQAPGEIVAWTESDDGKIVRRMPTYPFPRVPRYKGSGDPADPDSYEPVRSASWIRERGRHRGRSRAQRGD